MQELPWDARVRRLVEKLKITALSTACRLAGPRFAAQFIVGRADFGGYVPGRPTVVALTRPLFSKDLIELRKRTDLNWVYVNNEFLGHAQSAWCPPEMRFQTKYQAFRGDRYARAWSRLDAFGDELVRALRARTPVDAFMTSHIDYWQAESARLGAKRHGVPFLGLCREHMCLPIEQRTVRAYYTGFRYEGNSIALFGDSTRRIFIESGACTPDQIVVTGPPRLDIWRDIDVERVKRDTIVLLSYRDPDYRAPNSFKEVLRLFLAAAQRHAGSGVRFVVKAKNIGDSDEIRSAGEPLEHFVEIDHQVPLTSLLPRARLVVGFNSLSVLEAQFCKGRTAVPYWGDAMRPSEELMFDPADPVAAKVIDFPRGPEAFDALIDEAARGDLQTTASAEERYAVIRGIFHIPADRSCSKEVERYVLNAIGKNDAAAQ
ncbi:hypothetical protein [Rhizobium wuzhouense]|uniref:Glycosyltransferase family 1 protein n=1 Tax=Rhizobium wuzhouense TaxID=1986026 RepID=A0ABX5NXQ2_9HYPH|nr:hypothetical protein [Rhizobium wuzhouense]PYB77104.1 hypothetical protein DMY87_01635 [Rhizobium wuzhouense]